MLTNIEYPMIGTVNLGLDDANMRLQAGRSFMHAYNCGRLGQFFSKISGGHNHLESLASQPVSSPRKAHRIVPVAIRQIKGSLGRSDEFDADFNPLQERSRSRWVSIATAVQMGISMPAVELVQVGEVYYVRDGHHRISVAKSMKQEMIEAAIVN